MVSQWESDFADMLDEQVTLEPYLGTGARGPQFGPAQVVGGLSVNDTTTLTRSGDGSLSAASATLQMAADTQDFPVGSRVTLPSGRRATVLRQSIQEQKSMGWRYQMVTLG